MATFPSGIFSVYTLTDNVDDVLASHPNSLSNEINAIETKVGVNSSSDATSIDYFLKNVAGAYRTHSHDGSSDDGSTTVGPLTSFTIANNVDVGNFQIRASSFYADITTGTAPFTVSSTTVVTNLNADMIDNLHSTNIVQTTTDQTVAGVKTFSSFPVTPSSAPTTDYQVSNKKYVDDQIATTSTVSILTGTITHGSTIPLPDGYTSGQCKWTVGAGALYFTDDQHATSFKMMWSVDSSRVVTVTYRDAAGSGTYQQANTGYSYANYIIIGVS